MSQNEVNQDYCWGCRSCTQAQIVSEKKQNDKGYRGARAAER